MTIEPRPGRVGGADAGAAEDERRRSGNPGPCMISISASEVETPGRRSARSSRRSPRRDCAAGCWSPCRRRCRRAPFTRRFGNFAGRTVGSFAGIVVVGAEIDGVLVEVVEQRMRDLLRAAPRCSASPPADRCRSSRNSPARRSAARAWKSPAPCAPARRRSPGRRADGTCPSRRRRCRADFRYGLFQS